MNVEKSKRGKNIMCDSLTDPQKLGHRLCALENTGWTELTKNEMRQVLTLEYTSSDESCYECESDSEEVELICYKTKHLPWERARLTKAKKDLDVTYEKRLTRRVCQSRVPRELHSKASDRPIPLNFIEWAARRTALVGRGGSHISSSSASSTGALSSFSHSYEEDRVLDPLHFSIPLSSCRRSTRQQ